MTGSSSLKSLLTLYKNIPFPPEPSSKPESLFELLESGFVVFIKILRNQPLCLQIVFLSSSQAHLHFQRLQLHIYQASRSPTSGAVHSFPRSFLSMFHLISFSMSSSSHFLLLCPVCYSPQPVVFSFFISDIVFIFRSSIWSLNF